MPETSLFMKDMTGVFNTPLTASEEALFVAWAVYNNRRECQDFCVWGGYSRGSPTRLPFVFL